MKKIAVLGGGQVGASVAKILTDDGNDITLVDNNASVLEDLQEDNDIKTIQRPYDCFKQIVKNYANLTKRTKTSQKLHSCL